MRRFRISPAMVVACVALFVALGGTAVALNGQNTVQSDDLGPGAQVKAPDVAANAVKGSNVVDGSIAGADIAASALPMGRKVTSSCDPAGTGFVDCGHVTLNLPRPGLRVLIVTGGEWYNSMGGTASSFAISEGTCRIGVNGAPFGPDIDPGELQVDSTDNATHSMSLANVTPANGAGVHTFGLACNEREGDIKFTSTYLTAVVLGPG